MEAALRGLAQNSRDVGFVLLYTTDRDSIEEFSRETSDSQSFVKTAGTDCGSVAYGSAVAEDIAVGEEESEITLTLAGAMGAIDLEGPGDHLPRTLTSHRLQAVDECGPSKLTDIIRRAHIRDELVLMRDDEMDAFEGCLKPNVFEDIPQQAAVIPIKASAEDRCHGILVVGLSTRLFVSLTFRPELRTETAADVFPRWLSHPVRRLVFQLPRFGPDATRQRSSGGGTTLGGEIAGRVSRCDQPTKGSRTRGSPGSQDTRAQRGGTQVYFGL
jgi:hypothetical protein